MRRLLVALLAVLAALDLVILGIRIGDTFSLGRLTVLPLEGPVLYAIWKIRHGYALYEWPTRPYFTLTLYNFLFYRTYAALFSVLHIATEAVSTTGRLVTIAFAAAGAIAQCAAVARLVPVTRSFRVPLLLIAIVTWFGGALPGWWALAIRPDVPGAAIATWAVVATLTAFATGKRGWLAAAGAAFVLAWAFKQSQIALFAATCAYVLLWRRSFAELVWLVLPFAAGAAVPLVFGGAVYRANIIDAPRVNGLIAYLAVYYMRSVTLSDLLLWGIALYAVAALVRPGSTHGPLRSLREIPQRSGLLFGADVTYPALATVIAAAATAVLLAKIGSALNHVLELHVAAALLASTVLAAAWDTSRARSLARASALLAVPMIAFAAALLIDDDGLAAVALQLKARNTALHLTTPAVAADRERIADLIGRLPKPVYMDDEVFAQPSYATGGRYPAVVIDHVFYDAADHYGLVGRGVEGLFTDRYFASAVLAPSSGFLAPALRAGYRIRGTLTRVAAEPAEILVRER